MRLTDIVDYYIEPFSVWPILTELLDLDLEEFKNHFPNIRWNYTNPIARICAWNAGVLWIYLQNNPNIEASFYDFYWDHWSTYAVFEELHK